MTVSANNIFMKRALQLAVERRGFCAPNPAVGAVVVKQDKIIGEGTHWAYGSLHAEAAALTALKSDATDGILYVTLEPCSHYGKTPPCTESIIASGIREVWFGMRDPNPQVSGKGSEVLQQAGIVCRHLPSAEVENFYQSYHYWLQKKLPWVTLKLAMSLDGKIAGSGGKPIQLTGALCQQFTHQQRYHTDAILTTAATIIADNPQLNARLDQKVTAKPLYILDSRLDLPLNAQILSTAQSITVFHDQSAPAEKCKALQQRQVNCVAVSIAGNELNLPEILTQIGADGRHDLWVEAGGKCFQSFILQKLANRVFIYIAPKLLGAAAIPAWTEPLDQYLDFNQCKWTVLEPDVVAEFNL